MKSKILYITLLTLIAFAGFFNALHANKTVMASNYLTDELKGEDGYDLWLRYGKIENAVLLRNYRSWDNLNRTVERGYAGFSLWDWFRLPDIIHPRYIDYARANASIGINGTVLTNVNANAQILTPVYLEKVKALAGAFRPYGLKVYLTARFSAPIELDNLSTADPDTYAKGEGSTVAKTIDGSLFGQKLTGMAGVSNIGTDRNWTGHPFGQANCYAFGRLAWDPYLCSQEIADEWIKMTFTKDIAFVNPVKEMMLNSREVL